MIQLFCIRHQPSQKASALIGLIILSITLTLGSTTQAQSPPPPPPSEDGLPPGTVGGGSRTSNNLCQAEAPLVALAPLSDPLKTTGLYPSLWFYIPEQLPHHEAELILYDANDVPIVDTTVALADHQGNVLGIDLASVGLETPLQSDHHYRWFFSILCPDNRAADMVVHGWLQPTWKPLALAQGLQQHTDPAVQAGLYAEHGFWAEAFRTLSTPLPPDAPQEIAIANAVMRRLGTALIPMDLIPIDLILIEEWTIDRLVFVTDDQ